MASITRIEVANFLSDGYSNGKEWVPLYRGETLRLFGQSAALQIDNGGGKTSLTEACLYLLSRHRQLKPRVEDRAAPVDKGWTHIRIEFVEKPHNENILQSSLITEDPEEVLGTPYVIGLCWNRGKDPYFYRYQGFLEDALCFKKTANKLELIDNESFRKSVKEITGARWDTWRNIAEWHEEIRQFTNIEIIKQNVEFQLEGAGDYSAMVTKVKPQNGEPYAEAFFRQFVAPELLRQPLGDEGEEDEQKFEDALFKTLKPTADALVDIAKQQRDLQDATDAINKFRPVEEKAEDILRADKEYKDELDKIVRESAIVYELAVKHPLPGIPVIPARPKWFNDKALIEALSHLVIDRQHGVLITDQALANITKVGKDRFNEKARDLKLAIVPIDRQVIDLKDDLKIFSIKAAVTSESDIDSQTNEYKNDLKKTAAGRRYNSSGYDLDSAKALVNAVANLTGAKTDGVNDILARAFGIVSTELDTNPYRVETLRLTSERKEVTRLHTKAKEDQKYWQTKYEELITTERECQENQVAYETFAARKEEFPEEHWKTPLDAKKWAEEAREKAQQGLAKHNELKGKLTEGFQLWESMKSQYGIISLPSALNNLNDIFKTASEKERKASEALKAANKERMLLLDQLTEKKPKLTALEKNYQTLTEKVELLPKFREIFGDVDPDTLDPQKSLREDNLLLQKKSSELEKANRQKSDIDALLPGIKVFQEVFGEVNPLTLDPLRDLIAHQEKISQAEKIQETQRPYLDALNKFREINPTQTPDDWLQKALENRVAFNKEKIKNTERIEELRGELADLDQYAVADNRVYASALTTLQKAGIVFERLHEVVTHATWGDRQQQLLMLFSAALSAPVVSSIEDADRATEILEAARLTVPVFFKPALNQFVSEGIVELSLSGLVVHTFWVGRKTRQVAILLDPALIEEEKKLIQTDMTGLVLRNNRIDEELVLISEDSDAVKIAVAAKDAIQQDAEKKFWEAENNLIQLNEALPAFLHRASDEARKSIEAMKKYFEAGGEAGYQEVTEILIPRLVAEKEDIKDRIAVWNTQVTEEANRALLAAKDYMRLGGDAELNRLAQAIKMFDIQITSLNEKLEGITRLISEELEVTKDNFTENLNTLKNTYYTEKSGLEAAIKFEDDGNVAFMEKEPATRVRLKNDAQTAQHRLENIDFARASHYIQMTKSDQKGIADQLAEANRKRIEAGIRIQNTLSKITEFSDQIMALSPFVEALHDMVVAIRSQHVKIAGIPDDIRHRIQDAAVHPEIIEDAEAIRLACLSERSSTSGETREAIVNLKVAVEELSIDTKQLLNLNRTLQRTKEEFEEKRSEFCERARIGEIKGLHNLEIEQIENANTLEQLKAIHDLKDKIDRQIKEHQTYVEKLKEVMEANKNATVDSLAHFAQQAKINLAILDKVMRRKPDARFIVKAEIASEERIRQIIESLIAEIEDRESAARERFGANLNDDIDRRNKSYKEMIHDKIYRNIFIDPQVSFIHTAIREGETPLTEPGSKLSTGQHTALAMMWLVRQAEYAQDRVAQMYGTRKEQRAALKGSQRIMFFDGLFSNLSNESYINAAFHGLKDVGDNFQLIGLIHNPHYVNNKDIFPTHLVGKRKLAKSGDKNRVFVAVEPWQEDNGMIVYTSAYKHNAGSEQIDA